MKKDRYLTCVEGTKRQPTRSIYHFNFVSAFSVWLSLTVDVKGFGTLKTSVFPHLCRS